MRGVLPIVDHAFRLTALVTGLVVTFLGNAVPAALPLWCEGEDFTAQAGSRGPDRPVFASDGFMAGKRSAELEDLEEGRYHLRVRLISADGVTALERIVALELRATMVVTVVLSRNCRGIECPLAEDDPALTACLGGRCVNPACTPQTRE